MGKMLFSTFIRLKKAFSGTGLSNVPGAKPLYRRFHKIVDPKGIILLSVGEHKMYVNSQDKVIVPQLLTQGVWEKYETELFTSLVKPKDIVLDVGANFGYFSMIAAKLVGDEGKVYSFEPAPDNYELLVKNIKLNNYTNIVPTQKAVSDEKGKLKLFLDRINWGGSSFSEDNILPQDRDFVEVETVTLDDFFESQAKEIKVNFIKLDVEGAEGQVLEGASKILQNSDLKILMEFWPYGLKNLGTDPFEMLKNLHGQGFKIQLIDEENETVKEEGIMKIIEICEGKSSGMGQVNLLLEK
jgi:FkbM family methyltransferase